MKREDYDKTCQALMERQTELRQYFKVEIVDPSEISGTNGLLVSSGPGGPYHIAIQSYPYEQEKLICLTKQGAKELIAALLKML